MKKIFLMAICFMVVILSVGCGFETQERIKLRDLDFTILSEEMIPTELKKIVEERKKEPFKLTYSDNNNLYICIGYGMQDGGGYSITVNELYLTDNAIYVNTSLLGPKDAKSKGNNPSYPYIIIKTEPLEQTVIFE